MHYSGYLGGLLSLATVALSVTYKPIGGFENNRLNFYEHEKRLATSGNPQGPVTKSDNLRLAHFDTHWHGLSIEEYADLADDIRADVLVARGVPEKQGHPHLLRERLIQRGFDATSVIQEPTASLTSGMLVGVRQGITVESSTPIIVEGRTAAVEVALNLTKREKLLLIVLTLDAFDYEARLRQLSHVNARLALHEQKSPNFMILGGFYGSINKWSKEMRAINIPDGVVTSAFTALDLTSPSYTSWLGVFSDTALVSRSLQKSLRSANVWHTDRADCLPIVTDLNMAHLGISPLISTDRVESRFSSVKRSVMSWNWRMMACGFGTTSVVLLMLIAFVSYFRRSRGEAGKKIQGTATFSDSDLKIASSDKQNMAEGEIYPDEKEKY